MTLKSLSSVARWLVVSLLATLLVVNGSLQNEPGAEAAPSDGTCAAGLVKPLHGPKVYYDIKNPNDYRGKYLGYEIDATVGGSAAYKIEIPSLTSNPSNTKFYMEFAANQPTVQSLGSVSTKASTYFLAQLYTPNAINKNTQYIFEPFAVRVYKDNVLHCTFQDDLDFQRSTIAANANKIFSARVSAASTSSLGPGSMVVVTVTGNTGTVGSGPYATNEINLVPVSLTSAFDPGAWELRKVEYKGSNPSCSKVDNRLYLTKASSPTSLTCAGVYAANFLFVARSSYTDGANSKIQAFSYIASGQLIKHTTPYSTDISLPRVSSTSSTIPTLDPNNLPDLSNELATAPIPFIANDLEFITAKNTAGNGPAFIFAGGAGAVNWTPTCILNASSVCVSSVAQTNGTWSIVNPGDGTRRIRFTPTNNYVTPAWDSSDPAATDPRPSVTFRLTDTNGATAEAIALVSVDDTLVTNDLSFRTGAGVTTVSQVPTYGGDTGGINWGQTSIWNGSAWTTGSVTNSTGTWSIASSGSEKVFQFAPANGYTGNTFIEFRLSDNNSPTAKTASAVVYVTVDPAPSVGDKNETTTMGATVTISPVITPSGLPQGCIVDGASCSTSKSAQSYSWTVNSNNTVTFKSELGFTGSATISLRVTDAFGASDSGTISVTVNPPAAPTITVETGTTSTSKPVTLSPTVTSTLTTTICLINPADTSSCSNEVTIPGKGTWKKNSNGTITFTSVDSFTGSATISARVTDQINQTGTGTQTVNVNAPTAPAVSSPSGTTAVNTAITASVVVTSELPISTKCLVDPADPTSCSNTVVIAGKGTFTRVGDQVRFNAGANTGSATVSFRAVDSLGRSAHGTVSITITDDPNFNANAVPVPTTSAATNVTQTTARINGNVQSGNVTTNITFCYGLQATLVGCTTVTATPAQISGGSSGAVYYDLTGLTGSTTYWFRVIATDSNPYYGATLSFTTTAAPSNNPTPEPAPTSDPCEPGVTTSSLEPGLYSKLIGYLVKLFGTAGSWSSSFFGGVVQSPIADALVATMAPNPLLTQAGYDALTQTKLSIVLQAAAAKAAPKTVTPQEQLTQEEVVLQPGPNPGEVEITTTDGDPLSVLAVSPEDPFFSTQFSGSDFNKPEVWEFLGYGQLCWKLEPFGETDLSYVLPNPIKLPAGTAAGDWRYSNVIVKAGALTARSDTYQTDTIFPAPAPGSVVWPDVNANGVFDAGGRGGDKAISHIIFCVTKGTTATQSAQATKSPSVTASPTPSTSSTSPSPTQTSTATPTPTSSGTNTATPTPTQTSTQTPTPSSSTPAPSQTTQTPTPTQTSTPTPTATANCPIPTSSATVAPREPKPTETPKVIFKLNTPSPTPTPTTTQTSTPTPTQTSTPTPSPTPSSSATQTPSPSATPSPSNSVTPSPTQTPAPTQTSTPSPTQTSTPSPSASSTSAPTPTQTSTPSPTSTAPVPTSTATPSPTFTYTPTFTPLGEKLCEPNQPNGVAMVLSNGVDRLCYQTTTFAFFNAASFVTSGLDGDGVDELADTGFNVELWLFVASLLGLAGALLLGIARFGRKN